MRSAQYSASYPGQRWDETYLTRRIGGTWVSQYDASYIDYYTDNVGASLEWTIQWMYNARPDAPYTWTAAYEL